MLRDTEIVKKLKIQIPTFLFSWSQKAFPCQLAGICLNCVVAAKTRRFTCINSGNVIFFYLIKFIDIHVASTASIHNT